MSYQKKVKLISTKGLTKGLINNYSILNGRKYFGGNGSQNYLVYQPFYRYFTSKNGKIVSWQSEESIASPSTTDNNFDPEIIYNYGKGKIKFKGIFLKQDSVSFIHGNMVNLYISYKFIK